MAKRDPRALLFTTQRWPSAAMMARSLRDGGFQVGALCPPGHPLRGSVSQPLAKADRVRREHLNQVPRAGRDAPAARRIAGVAL